MRFWEAGKTFKEMFSEPCVDVMIMTRDNYDLLKRYCEEVENPIPLGIKIFIHKWVGDLILYGSRKNKLVKQILETCDGTGPHEIQGGQVGRREK